MSYLWTNTIWYILLGITTILELAYILYKSEQRKPLLAFYLTAAGVAFVVESIIFMIFKAYNYYPMLLPGNTLHDGLIGNLFSQFSVSATALLIAVFSLPYRYCIIFASIYGIIEEFFLFLGIYSHNWYQTWMTIVGLLIYFPLVRIMYAKMNSRLTPLLSYLYMFLGLWSLHFGFTVFPFMIFGYQIYLAYIFPDPTTNQTILMIGNYILQYTVLRWVYFASSLWLWMPIGMFILLVIDYLQYRLQLLYVKEGWFFAFSMIDMLSMYFYIYTYDKLTKSNGK